jgi:O-antigen/teichoic acid export membrane protein
VQTQLTRYFAMATIPIVFGLAVASKPFMDVFTGAEYRSAYGVLPVVAAGVMLYGVSQIASNGLAMYKKTVIMMQNTFVAAVFQVGMNLLLVPRFGYAAAAWNTFLSYLVLLTLAWWRSRPYMEWKLPWADLLRIVAAGAVMAGAISFAFRWFDAAIWMLAAQALVGVAVYGVALWTLRGLRPDEIAFLGEVLAAIRRKLRLGGRAA